MTSFASFDSSDPLNTRECGSCTRASNNRFFDCPARMSDGRLFTDYRPRGSVEFQFASGNSEVPLDSYKYRQYLIHNADKIMQNARDVVYENAVCGPCSKDHDQSGTMLPARVVQKCDENVCSFMEGDPHGSGLGTAYGSAAFVDDGFFGRKKDERKRMKQSANCCTKLPDDLKYNPKEDEDLVHVKGTGRLTIPFGGMAMNGGDPSAVRKRMERDLKEFKKQEATKEDNLFV